MRDKAGRFVAPLYIRKWYESPRTVEDEVRILHFVSMSGFGYKDEYGSSHRASGRIAVVVERVRDGQLFEAALSELRRKVEPA